MSLLPFRIFNHRKDGYAVPVDGKPQTAVRKKKSAGREWFDAIIFAVIAATLIRTLLLKLILFRLRQWKDRCWWVITCL